MGLILKSMDKKPVYIIADNIITPLGFNTRTNIDKIAAGKTGVQCHDDTTIYPTPVWVSKISAVALSAAAATLSTPEKYTKLEQMFLLSVGEAIQQTSVDITSKETLIIVASTKGNINLLNNKEPGAFS